MDTVLRLFIVLVSIAGLALAGFVLGTIANILNAIPDLTAGGHATGGGNANFAIPGSIAGGFVGFVWGIFLWRQLKPGRS